jgi:ribonuclease J
VARSGRLTVFDGSDAIGGTKILFEQGDARILLDFGTNYQKMSRYYEEFLKPRSSRGLVDYLELGLLPRQRGWYRSDLFPPYDYPQRDTEFAGQRPTAVLLTHGHLDHCGGVAFLDPTIPVYLTPMSLALLRSWQETGRPDVTNEVTYVAPRVARTGPPEPGDSLPGRLLETERGGTRGTRAFRLFGDVPAPLADRLAASPYGERTAFEADPPKRATPTVEGVKIEAAPVDHSVYGASAFLLEADGALIAYTGDLRFHGEHGAESEAFLRRLEARHPDILIAEGTRLRPEGSAPERERASESDVEATCRRDIDGHAGRLVVADFGPRNVERLRTFRAIALATGRELVLTPKDAHLLTMLHAVDPAIEVDFRPGAMRILEEPSAGRESPWLSLVRDRYGDAHLTPPEIAAAPGKWILCFSFFDCNDLVDLRAATPGGLWLYSSSEAHGEEQEFDFKRLRAWIDWAGMHSVGFRYLTGPNGQEQLTFDHPDDVGHHASGHATQAELLELVRRANPRRLVPVHTSQPPQRYAQLLRDLGAEVEVVAPKPGVPITW